VVDRENETTGLSRAELVDDWLRLSGEGIEMGDWCTLCEVRAVVAPAVLSAGNLRAAARTVELEVVDGLERCVRSATRSRRLSEGTVGRLGREGGIPSDESRVFDTRFLDAGVGEGSARTVSRESEATNSPDVTFFRARSRCSSGENRRFVADGGGLVLAEGRVLERNSSSKLIFRVRGCAKLWDVESDGSRRSGVASRRLLVLGGGSQLLREPVLRLSSVPERAPLMPLSGVSLLTASSSKLIVLRC
jgi:hypothetical protein